MKDREFRKKLGVIDHVLGRVELEGGEKKALGQALKSALRSLAKNEGWQTGEYEVRYNPGGWAVKGDGVLHGPDLYLSVSPDSAGPGVLVRNCQGLKDYQGGPNGWMSWKTFLGAESPRGLMEAVRKIAPRKALGLGAGGVAGPSLGKGCTLGTTPEREGEPPTR